jgi:ribosomal protein L37AE/L43A
MTGNGSRRGDESGDDPTCPLCGSALEVVERFGSRWWYCDGDGHSYSRELEA